MLHIRYLVIVSEWSHCQKHRFWKFPFLNSRLDNCFSRLCSSQIHVFQVKKEEGVMVHPPPEDPNPSPPSPFWGVGHTGGFLAPHWGTPYFEGADQEEKKVPQSQTKKTVAYQHTLNMPWVLPRGRVDLATSLAR